LSDKTLTGETGFPSRLEHFALHFVLWLALHFALRLAPAHFKGAAMPLA